MNILTAQSGGPTSVINAALAGILSRAFKEDKITEVFGGVHGIHGILEEKIIPLYNRFADNPDDLKRLRYTPDMYLKSCRYKMKDPLEDDTDYRRIFEIFEKYNIDIFLYIGGNDSMDTVAKLASYAMQIGSNVRIAGVPKTIDNDLVLTDHSPGYGSAAKYVASTVREVILDTCLYPTDNVSVVEIMGRDAGWLTAAAALATPENCGNEPIIFLPELPFEKDILSNNIGERLMRFGYAVVAVSEGIKDKDGAYISAGSSGFDKFGHAALSGTGRVLSQYIKDEFGCKVRSIELASAQRSAGHIASFTDNEESFTLGHNALDYTLQGKTGIMAGMIREENKPYTIRYTSFDVSDIANKVKNVPIDLIHPETASVSNEIIEYIRPLIHGEVPLSYKDGLPDYIYIYDNH